MSSQASITAQPLQANCFAGFNVRQSGGTTLVTPLVNGIETGTSYTMVAGRLYTLRIHLHSPEMLRIRQSFYALDDTASGVAVTEFGGGLMNSPVSLVFEIRDLASSSNTPVTVLYDGTSASSPAQVNVVPVNSLELAGSIGALHLTRTGSCWVRSTPSSGAPYTRLAGASTDGVDCSVTSSSAGKVTFFNGRIPAAGETIAVFVSRPSALRRPRRGPRLARSRSCRGSRRLCRHRPLARARHPAPRAQLRGLRKTPLRPFSASRPTGPPP